MSTDRTDEDNSGESGIALPDTDDVRHGPDLHPALLGLLPLLGSWQGTGKAVAPDGEDYDFAERVRFAHDGGPVLSYSSRSWRPGAEGAPAQADEHEAGWWRPVGNDDFEVVLARPDGIAQILLGHIDGVKFECDTDAVARVGSAPAVTASRRLYGIVEGALLYAVDNARDGRPLAPERSARLERLGPPLLS